MSKRSAAQFEDALDLTGAPLGADVEMSDADFDDQPEWPRRAAWYWRLLGIVLVLAILLTVSFQIAYWKKIYPGVTAYGVELGGMSRSAASARLADKISAFSGQALAIQYDNTTLRIPVHDLDVQYQTDKTLDEAYDYGRRGDWLQRAREQVRALLGRPTAFTGFSYNQNKLIPYLMQVSEDSAMPAQNASLAYANDSTKVTPAADGRRLDLGRLIQYVEDRLSRTDHTAIAAPVYTLEPQVKTAALNNIADQATGYLSGPITVTYNDVVREIPRSVITGWLGVTPKPVRRFTDTADLAALYPPSAGIQMSLNRSAITNYVNDLAGRIDQQPRNAVLAMDNGQLKVTTPSQKGVALERNAAVDDIIAALAKPANDRHLTLPLKTTQPDVREDNLEALGIKEQLSQGASFFPGSGRERLQNVRAGATKFNGVLLKPDEVFSFGALLGDVGPETGYAPAIVIVGNHEEVDYGGGLCQVSSTAFRAALLAGLPIVERHNHSFAVEYYTAPYGVPGVDATIYYPQVDFKFKNDTGHYLLIQTTMQGTTLKFDFYGTKTKSGTIRGPEFITGTMDATKPSHTVFYRDVLDQDGKVTKTDTFHTYYKSSNDFPLVPQFN